MDPKGKVALLTGGARIGQVVTESLAANGCDLGLIYHGSREAAEVSAKAATSAGVRAIIIQADMTNEDQIAAAVQETHRALAVVVEIQHRNRWLDLPRVGVLGADDRRSEREEFDHVVTLSFLTLAGRHNQPNSAHAANHVSSSRRCSSSDAALFSNPD